MTARSPLRILVAPDSFKGSLSALEAGRAMARGFHRATPGALIDVVPMADGGEGTAATVALALQGTWSDLEASNANGETVCVPYATCVGKQIGTFAVFDASALVALDSARLPHELRSTAGIGQAIVQLFERGFRTIVVGLGGTSTNDAGIGMLSEVRFHFSSKQSPDRPLNHPTYKDIAGIDHVFPRADRDELLSELHLIGLSDVDSPLTGQTGASFVFGPQKGVTDLHGANETHRRFASLLEPLVPGRLDLNPGAGAAGGLGYAICVLGGQLVSGAQFITDVLSLSSRMQDFDLAATGEGRSDHQTLLGKGPIHIAHLARRAGTPVVLLSGSVERIPALERAFDGCFAISSGPASLEEAMRDTAAHLEATAYAIGLLFEARLRPRRDDF